MSFEFRRRSYVLNVAALGVCLAASPAFAIDWSKASGKDIALFYPGQASWEWVLTEKDHSGAPKFRGGKNCVDCHEGEQKEMGERIVTGKKLEPAPIPGKRGSVTMNVKAAYDAANLYLRLQWPDQNLKIKPEGKDQAKVTVLLDDGAVPEATRAGCWGVCHDDANGMASHPAGQDIKKYLAKSRIKITRQGGGLNYKTDAEIAALAASGHYLEYWQAHLNSGKPATATAGHILKAREATTPGAVKASAELQNGVWTVVLSRPLKAAGPYEKAIAPGKTYAIGFAIHDSFADGRHHYVSFGYSLALDDKTAAVPALKQ